MPRFKDTQRHFISQIMPHDRAWYPQSAPQHNDNFSEHKSIISAKSYPLEELLCTDARPGVERQLHLADLLVNFLHEMDNKVHQLVLEHLLRVKVGDQERDVVALRALRLSRSVP